MAEKSEIAKKIDSLKETIANNEKEIDRLNGTIALLKEQLDAEMVRRVKLETQYKELIEGAALVSANKGDIDKARKQISAMIDEIDRCIKQLSE